ncbi:MULTISPECIES: helix-turn-helix domain-containing protein [Rhodococcus]|uniref:helix-turn-helix domain-containing protein n=1 Tax=Rhodococcus TaxID=1827 RepID=UPI000C7DED7C|nr:MULTISPECIES: helix-turn-helix transcriptional regulator [Rhodococcus]AUM18283.1 hypothetical protein CSW53_18180 [Rhodococcus ruber]
METDKRQAAARVAELLRQGREAAGLSKKKAAELSGMSEGRWRQLEKGVEMKAGVEHPATTSAKTLVKMARAIGIEAKTLLETAGFVGDVPDIEAQANESLPTRKLTPESIDVSDLNDFERRLVEAYISGIRAHK